MCIWGDTPGCNQCGIESITDGAELELVSSRRRPQVPEEVAADIAAVSTVKVEAVVALVNSLVVDILLYRKE